MTQPFDTHEAPFETHDAPFDRFDQFGGAAEEWTDRCYCKQGALRRYCWACGTHYCQVCGTCLCSIWDRHHPDEQDGSQWPRW